MILPSLSIVPYAHNRAGNMFTQFPLDGGFTVSSSDQGTIVNANGIIERSPRNLCINTQTFTAASWIQTSSPTIADNAEIAPDGTMTAAVMTNGQIQYTTGIGVIGKKYTCSMYIRRISGTGTVRFRAIENINTDIIVTSEWQRFSLTVVATTTTLRIGINLESGTSTVAIWGAQIEESLTPTPYQRIDASRLNFPRIDWLGQSCPGLLVEPSAQNLALQSEAFDSVSWNTSVNGRTLVTSNVTSTLDPYGGNAADLLSDDNTASSTHRMYTASNVSITSGTTYSTSFFVKANTTPWFEIRLMQSNETDAGISGTVFNLTSGTITSGSGTIQNYGNGWYRCTNIGTSNFTGNGRIFFYVYDSSGTKNYNGTSSNSLYIFGAQLEVGSIATTYIPTTTGTGSRAADTISLSNVSNLIGQTEGTLYAEVDVRNWQNQGVSLNITIDGDANNSIRMYSLNSNQFVGLVRTASVNQAVLPTSTGLANGVYKMALAYKTNDFAFYVNGSLVGTDTSGTPPACNFILLGQEGVGFTTRLNDRIRAAALYTTRLSNAQLELLTKL